jgi:hypothetical protein
MVANSTLLHIHQRLKEIFGTNNSNLFAGISIIAVGDLYQLPPIRRRLVFETYRNDAFNLCHPWHMFQMIELTEIMRRQHDLPFTAFNQDQLVPQTQITLQMFYIYGQKMLQLLVTTNKNLMR